MTKPQRYSRYHCSGNPPPYLDCVIKQIKKVTAGQGFVRRKPDIRSLAAKAHQDYSDRGKSDDLVRFLLNVGILIELPDDKRVYFDAERLARIIHESSLLLENVQRSLVEAEVERRRRETARWEALYQRQGELTAERVSLSSRLREMDQELADIAGKLPPEGHPFWKTVS